MTLNKEENVDRGSSERMGETNRSSLTHVSKGNDVHPHPPFNSAAVGCVVA